MTLLLIMFFALITFFDNFSNAANTNNIVSTIVITIFRVWLYSLGFFINVFCLVSINNKNRQFKLMGYLTKSFLLYSNL